MPGKTVSQRLEELAERVRGHIPVADQRMDDLEDDVAGLVVDVKTLELLPQQVADLKERVRQLESLHPESARHDERIKALEKTTDKSSDRRWQLGPILLSAGSLLVAVVSAVVALIAVTKK